MLLPTDSAFLRHQAIRCGNRSGLIHRDRAYPFAALAAHAERVAGWLGRCGIGRGDHVLLIMGNHPALVTAMYGCWSLGAIPVPISIRSTIPEMTHVLGHARGRMILCDPERKEITRDVAHHAKVAAACLATDLSASPKRLVAGSSKIERRPRPPSNDEVAVLAYTSGTTGRPKGVMLTHANLLWSALACATARGDSEAGVGLCLSPLTHLPVFVSHVLCRILLGQTAVLIEKFDLDVILTAVERHQVTDLPLVAGMVFEVNSLSTIPEARRRTLRKVSVGGAATPMEAKRRLAELFPGTEVIEAYGQSESTNGVCMTRGNSIFERPGTVGKANPYVTVRVRSGKSSFATSDEEGEIVIGGPTVMGGYYRDSEATDAQLRQGWLHTGDLGRMDDAGYFYITGRVKDLIITGGENVSPAEVEEVLRRHPHIADVAVIGTPHPRWGEQVTAVVVVQPGAPRQADAITDFAGAHLAAFKKPRRVLFVDALPRNAANKVQTGLLKQTYGKEA